MRDSNKSVWYRAEAAWMVKAGSFVRHNGYILYYWACNINNLWDVDTVCRHSGTPGGALILPAEKTASCLISAQKVGFFSPQRTWKRRLRASFFKMGIKFPNLSQTKGCTLQSGRISGESHDEPTTEQEEGEPIAGFSPRLWLRRQV